VAWLTAYDPDVVYSFSEMRTFKTPAEVALPDAPVLTSPEDGSSAAGSALLQWAPVSEATKYQVHIRYAAPDYDHCWYDTAAPQFLVRDGIYFCFRPGVPFIWSVLARNGDGWSEESERWAVNLSE
jgi:hypothetical protein